MRSRLSRGAQGLIGDVLKKVPITGVGDIRVPSDVRRLIVANVESLRESALEIFANELSRFIRKVDVQHVLDDILNNYTLKLEARIDLQPKKGRRRPKTAKKGRA